ncbi:MAG: DNA polymerase III subunit chi [Rhodospirillaceae bacterium]|nr:DNA polymerase III subunit chi [Rhodospirillaceae bacterium]MBT7294088.1 DNA polymerase III subunit chi [Rhodospirillaceae bacterium]
MAEVAFYQLRTTALENALPRLLQKAFDGGHRVRVVGASEERMAALNTALWTFDQDSFLPHGDIKDGDGERQPILLSSESADASANENNADIVVTIDGVEPVFLPGVTRYLDMFDGNDETALGAARQRWTRRKAENHDVSYWQQGEGGGWEKRA